MVKSLDNLCLDTLCHSFGVFAASNHRLDLPPILAERLLHRLIDHDYLHGYYLPSITYNLLPPRLTRFEIYGSQLLDDSFLSQLGRACTNLTRIRLIRCPKLTDHGLCELLINQTRLEHLELRWLPTIDGRCLSRFSTSADDGDDSESGPASPHFLKVLSLKGCSSILPEHLYSCVQRNRSIQHLNLHGIRRLNGDWMRRIATALGDRLLDLNLSECLNMNDDGLYALAEHSSNLRRLSLMECMNVSEAGLRALLRFCTKLECVDFAFCRRWGTGLTYDLFQDIPTCIRSLCLSGIQAEFTADQFVSTLSALPHLARLILSGFGLLNDACLEKTLSVIGDRLETLDLSGSFGRISDVGLESITKYCTRLRVLGLGLLTNITGRSLIPLFMDRERASSIESLLLANCLSLDPLVLSGIAENCRNLERLDVSGIQQVDDAFVQTLADISSSNLLRFFAKAINKITDQSVCALASRATRLQCLCLSGNPNLTDRSVLGLAGHCHELQELYLSGCAMISQASIQYLQDRITGRLVVYHLVPTTGALQATVIAKNLDTGEYVRV